MGNLVVLLVPHDFYVERWLGVWRSKGVHLRVAGIQVQNGLVDGL